MFRQKWFMGSAIALLALAGLSVACGGDDDDDSGGSSADAATILGNVPSADESAPAGSKVFVGRTDDGNTSIGLIVFADDTAAAYACDGNQTWTWYAGEADGDDIELTSADGKKLTAEIDGSKVTGNAGAAFSLQTAGPDNHAGLYRATDAKLAATAGWVVENDGFTRGGFSLTLNSTVNRVGATFDAKRIADIEALPEFSEIKQALPNFPQFPADATVFTTAKNKVCGRLGVKLMEQSPPNQGGVVPDTAANRARLGLMGRLGCSNTDIFVIG